MFCNLLTVIALIPLYFHEAQQGAALLNNLGTESIIKRKRDESDERNFSDEHEVEKSGVEKSGVEKSGVVKKHNICTSLK